MPYSNVPEEKWGDMDSCVEQVMADGKTKEQAIAICYSSIVERQDIKEEVEDPIAEEKESPISEDDLLPADDEPVGLAAELGKEDAPVDQEIMDEDIDGEPEQEITEGIEGPPADEAAGIVKVEFIDDGDDFEMDAAIAGIGGDSPYPDMSGQEPPPYEPPGSEPPSEEDQGETPADGGAWTPPNISVQELMDMEPAAMFYNGSVKGVVQSERELRAWRRKVNRMQKIADLRPRDAGKKERPVERIKGVLRRLVGIKKSYPAPHCGLKGEQGGSAPRDECAAGEKISVGITSARPGKESGQVFEEMRSFAGELNQIPTIKNVSVTPGLGGWQGGRESTWVVHYEGNGDAIRLIARTAKMHEQEGVLLTREGGDEPVSSFAFSDRVTPNERDEVESLLTEADIGGWQWFKLPDGKPTLRIVNVPQYGGDAESHRQAMKKLTQMFDAIEMPHEFDEIVKKVDILEMEGPYGYDTILEE